MNRKIGQLMGNHLLLAPLLILDNGASAGTIPTAGEIVISELLPDPSYGGSSTSSTDEWIELRSLVGTSRDLSTCTVSDLTNTNKALSPTGASLEIDPYQHLLLALDATGLLSRCNISAQADYSSVTQNVSDETITLKCSPGGVETVISSITYNWSELEGDEDYVGHSLMLHQAITGAVETSEIENWCIASSDDLACEYFDSASSVTHREYGTPGAQNTCPAIVATSVIQPGDIVMSEITIWPTSNTVSPDWVELEVVQNSDHGFDLSACSFRTVVCTKDEASCGAACADACIGQNYDSTWSSTNSIEPVSDLLVQQGERILIGSSGDSDCAEGPSSSSCQTAIDGRITTTLSESDVRVLELACPDESKTLRTIDRIVYTKEWMEKTCSQDDENCSWELRADSTNTTAPDIFNDVPSHWISSPATYHEPGGTTVNGTPGKSNAASGVKPTAGFPAYGDVAFSELLIDAATDTSEWMELVGVVNSPEGLPFELAGCQFISAESTEIGICNPAALGECSSYALLDTLTVPVGAEQYILGVKYDLCASFAEGEDGLQCSRPADFTYDAITLSDSATSELSLWCPDDQGGWLEIDALTFDWTSPLKQCPIGEEADTTACSYAVHPQFSTANGNDSLYHRCVAPASTSYQDALLDINYGTPGTANTCSYLGSPPRAGDLLITELAVWPSSTSATVESPDWLELFAQGTPAEGGYFELSYCEMRKEPCDGDATVEQCLAMEVASSQWTVGSIEKIGKDLLLPGGDYWLMGSSQDDLCVDAGDADDCLTVDSEFSGVTLVSDKPELLELACADENGAIQMIDRMVYDRAWSDVTCDVGSERCSLELRRLSTDPTSGYADNDLSQNWVSSVEPYVEPKGSYARGTPKLPNTAPPLIETSGFPFPGEVAISEMMVVPQEGAAEWIELQGVASEREGVAFELGGCDLLLRTDLEDEPCTPDSPGGCSLYQIPVATSLPVVVGERVLLVEGEPCLSYGTAEPDNPDAAVCEIPAHQKYGTLNFSSTSLQTLSLWCPDDSGSWQEIDAFSFEWDTVSSQCIAPNANVEESGDEGDSGDGESDEEDTFGGCTISVNPAHVGADENDNLYNRCVAPLDSLWYDFLGYPNSGTPGDENFCLFWGSAPQEGDVIFSEFATWPSETSNADWFELTVVGVPTADVFDLSQCQVRQVSCPATAEGLECLEEEPSSWTPVPLRGVAEALTAVQGSHVVIGSSESLTAVKQNDDGSTSEVNGYSSISLVTSDDRRVRLECPDEGGVYRTIDEALYDSEWSLRVCPLETGYCTWELRDIDVSSGSEVNDDPKQWTVSTSKYREPNGRIARGTPGQKSTAPAAKQAEGSPAVGDVVFSEVMINPSDNTPEWVELTGVADKVLELSGCEIQVVTEGEPVEATPAGDAASPTPADDTPDDDPICISTTDERCAIYDIPSTMTMTIESGQPRLLVQSSPCLSYGLEVPAADQDAPCEVEPDLQYEGLSFSATEVEILRLMCPDPSGAGAKIEVDRISYQWSDISEQCPPNPIDSEDGSQRCSLSVHQEHLTASENDYAYFRCIDEPGSVYYDRAGYANLGTPGGQNGCPELPSVPEPGAIIFTEIMVKPGDDGISSAAFAHEWFELYNTTDKSLPLSTCELVIGDEDTDAASLSVSAGATVHSLANFDAVIGAGEFQVWAEDGCIYGYGDECGFGSGDVAGGEELAADVAYSGLSFTNDEPRVLVLRCSSGPETHDVDVIPVNSKPVEEGHSQQLQPQNLNSSDNDDLNNWCQASFDQALAGSSGSGSEGDGEIAPGAVNYGTPGQPNTCGVDYAYEDLGPSCRCSAGEGSRPTPVVAWISFLTMALCFRRRSR